MAREAMDPIDFNTVAISQLATPTLDLPPGHVSYREIDYIARWAEKKDAHAAEKEAAHSSLVHANPALVGYIMSETEHGRTELISEEIPDVLFCNARALGNLIVEEGGVVNSDRYPRTIYMAIGKHLLKYNYNFPRCDEDQDFVEGSMTVRALPTHQEAKGAVTSLGRWKSDLSPFELQSFLP